MNASYPFETRRALNHESFTYEALTLVPLET